MGNGWSSQANTVPFDVLNTNGELAFAITSNGLEVFDNNGRLIASVFPQNTTFTNPGGTSFDCPFGFSTYNYPSGVATQPDYINTIVEQFYSFGYNSPTLFLLSGSMSATEPNNVAKQPNIKIQAPVDNNTNFGVSVVQVDGQSVDGTGPAQVLIYGKNGGITLPNIVTTNTLFYGFALAANLNAGVISGETWHGISYNANWADSAGKPVQYRLMPDGTVLMRGWATYSGGALASGSTIATLPVGYRPGQIHLQMISQAFAAPVTVQGQIDTNGNLQVFYGAAITNPTFSFDNFRYPLSSLL